MKKLLKKHAHATPAPNTTNYAGGEAYSINDPSVKLISMTGGNFYNEPRFYDAQACKLIPNKDLPIRLTVIANKIKQLENCSELDSVAQDIIATAFDILNGKNPEDLLMIANWLRNKMNIRLTPQVLLVLASSNLNGQPFVRRYAPKIVVRPDEVKTCLLLHRFFFGKKVVPQPLAKGLADSLSKFGEKALMKYDGKDFPTWKDVLCWLPRHQGYPLPKALQEYFTHGVVSNEVPICKARKELNSLTRFSDLAKKLIVDSQANWEVVLSQFGNKKEVWEHLISNDLLGYMALLRNLRNIAQSGADLKLVVEKLANREEVLRSKQLPFRYVSALKALQSTGLMNQNSLSEGIYDAMEVAMENVPVLPGVTAVFADNSGSMASPVSAKSQISCQDAANILAAMVGKRAETSFVAAFATDVAFVPNARRSSVGDLLQKISRADTKGWGTEAHRCFQRLQEQGVKVDRIIILSDCQTYNGSCQTEWEKYRRFSPGCWLHTVHLNGYGDSPVKEDKRVNMISGFSEKVFDTFLEVEGLKKTESGKPVTTIELIRQEFRA